MSVLDDTFKFFTTKPPSGSVWTMLATLTGTKQENSVPGFIATANTLSVTYNSGPPATISFPATIQYQVDPGKDKGVSVTLTQKTGGGGYSMKIVLHWTTVNCTANVDATSGVVYGSDGKQFVTLVLLAAVQGPPK